MYYNWQEVINLDWECFDIIFRSVNFTGSGFLNILQPEEHIFKMESNLHNFSVTEMDVVFEILIHSYLKAEKLYFAETDLVFVKAIYAKGR